MHLPNLYQRRVIRLDGLSVRRIIRRPILLLARLIFSECKRFFDEVPLRGTGFYIFAVFPVSLVKYLDKLFVKIRLRIYT